MNKRERVLSVLNGQLPDRVPGAFWFHFGGDLSEGDRCIQAHLDYYRQCDLDFIKIMSDGLNYPLRVRISKPDDWYNVRPLDRNDPFFTGTLERCEKLNDALQGECCTFYNMFSPFNIIRERDIFTPEALFRNNDATVMAHLRVNEDAVKHALNVIGEDLAWLCEQILLKTGVEGIYQSVQGAEVGRMTMNEYSRIVAPSELQMINRYNAVRDHNILHMCSWAGNRNHLLYWRDYPMRVRNWGIGIEGLSLTQAEGYFPEGSILLGGMDNRRDHPLYSGDRETIQSCVRECLREMDGKPFILGADCTVPADIDKNHIRWALEALRES